MQVVMRLTQIGHPGRSSSFLQILHTRKELMKPNLATDYDPETLRLPVLYLPKIDGVRGLHLTGGLTGRSLKKFKNKYTTERFRAACYAGLDGELACGSRTSQSLCRDTTSALNSIDGEPDVTWYVFDLLRPETVDLPYEARHAALVEYVKLLEDPDVQVVPYRECHTLEHVQVLHEDSVGYGYEGSILRDPKGRYKQGRSTVREGGYLRIKDFADAEALVLSIYEGQHNSNEATTNELGRTERSTHQENMVPNGMLGGLNCLYLGQEIKVSPGAMTHGERVKYFQHPELIVNKTIKFKSMVSGVKDKPRFATFLTVRMDEDIS